ncbi:MAG: hypothetical protein L0G99_07210 [Propionibacteriales bacterium]|nr:hypothetical protein [Propionibacteriales bacterium]
MEAIITTATVAEQPRWYACDAMPSSRALGVTSVTTSADVLSAVVLTEATSRPAARRDSVTAPLAPNFGGGNGTGVEMFGKHVGDKTADFGTYDPRSGPSWSPPI